MDGRNYNDVAGVEQGIKHWEGENSRVQRAKICCCPPRIQFAHPSVTEGRGLFALLLRPLTKNTSVNELIEWSHKKLFEYIQSLTVYHCLSVITCSLCSDASKMSQFYVTSYYIKCSSKILNPV